MPELSIILPCFNEEATLPAALEKLNDVITQASLDAEVIILDDESTDATPKLATTLLETYPALRIRIFHRIRHRRGYGAVVRFGMAYATGRYCCFVSADGLDGGAYPEF